MNEVYEDEDKIKMYLISGSQVKGTIGKLKPYTHNKRKINMKQQELIQMSDLINNVKIPSSREIILKLKKENPDHRHPRLLSTDENFSRIKEIKEKDENIQKWIKNITKIANKIMQEPVAKYEIPDGKRLLKTSRKVLKRIMNLALLYQLEGNKDYAERIWKEVESVGKFQDWNPSHFLDTAEMTNALAVAYDWLYDYWSKSRRKFIRNAIIENGLKAALPLYREQKGYVVREHNWNTVCNGGIGLGALAIGDEEEEIAGEILHGVLKSVPKAIAESAPDGTYPEGPTYWNYGIRYTVYLLSALETALTTDYGLSEIEGFSETGFFPIYMQGPGTATFNFADAPERNVAGAHLHWLAHRFDEPVFTSYQLKMDKEGSPYDVIWFRPGDYSNLIEKLPLQRQFKGKEQVASMRSSWKDDSLFVGIKAGNNQANHGDLDIGSFVLDAAGVRWACDLGKETYDIPGYWDHSRTGGRWNYYRKRAEGHNTLVINPSDTWDQDPLAVSEITRFEANSEKSLAVVDLTPAYNKKLNSGKRGIALINNCSQVLLQDELEFENSSELWWFMHTKKSIDLKENGQKAVLSNGNYRLSIKLLNPMKAKFEVKKASPLPTSPDPKEAKENEEVNKLAINLKNINKTRICILFTPPGEKSEKSFASKPEIIPLRNW
ncbi:MAG: DUF4962 domain-containing protein [Bacillota bacterium]